MGLEMAEMLFPVQFQMLHHLLQFVSTGFYERLAFMKYYTIILSNNTDKQTRVIYFFSQKIVLKIKARGKSLLESWGTTFLPDLQPPLIFLQFISKFLCMCSNSMASAHVILK